MNALDARRPTVADVIDRVLDKGVVIEYRLERVTVTGIDLLVTVDARCVVASLDTYLEYAEPLRTHRLGEQARHRGTSAFHKQHIPG